MFTGSGFALAPDIAEAIKYAADNADVLSCSWGYDPLDDPNDVIHKAIQTATSEGRNGKGCPVFFSSGNYAIIFLTYKFPIPSGNHTYDWCYWRDPNSNGAGLNSVWLDQVKFPNGQIENFDLGIPAGWITYGGSGYPGNPPIDPNLGWIPVDDDWHYGNGPDVQSVKSGDIGAGEYSVLERTMQNPNAGVLEFSYCISAEVIYDPNGRVDQADYFLFYRNGPLEFLNYGDFPHFDSIAFPASCAETISVGASTNANYRSYYSQFDPNLLDIVAPSDGGTLGIFTTDRTGNTGYNPNSDYTDTFSGTSSACPLAAGIAALVLSNEPDLTWIEVRQRLRDTTDKIGQFDYVNGRNDQYGYGQVNAYNALKADIYFSNQVISSGTHTGSSITAYPNVSIESGAVVTFDVESSITAENYFTIEENAVVTFDAENAITAGEIFIIEENAQVTFKATSITADYLFIVRSGAVVIFEATDYIVIGPDFIIESGAEVYLRAGNYVRILPEFTAHEGCVFEVDNLI